ncbi:MAG: hypothetical protein PHV28_15155, partial [Kiritimatiellae bacterium]|nr:hypothetical protein [Kiritimatiellia bacterium]
TVDSDEAYSAVSQVAATTVPRPAGFHDPMDTADNWDVTGAWGVDSSVFCEGTGSMADSPGANYPHNQSSYMTTSVNLSGTSWPVLRFRDRYALGAGDWLRVEISPNGSGWTRLYGVYGQGARADWQEQEIDLSQWKNEGNVRLRFIFAADNNVATTEDGWFVDDVSVVDHAPAAIPYPLYEGFEEAGWTNRWIAASWLALTNNPRAGASALADRPTTATRMSPDTQHYLTLAGELDLTGTANPQIVFWVRGTLPSYSQLRLFVSRDGGLSWPYEYADARVDNGANLGWTRRQASLAEHTGLKVRLRFMLESFYSEIPAGGLTIDGLVVKDRPAASLMLSPAPHLKSVDLTWTASTLGAGFKRYELYRSTDATLTTADTLICSTTNLADLAFTDFGPDGGLNQGWLYYYGIFTVDADEMYSAVSTASAWTQVQSVGFTNPMEDMALLDRTAGSRWGAESNYANSGSACIADSPGIDYPASQGTTYLRFCVDLSTASWPVLRFHDRYALGAGDWAAAEVSVNESGWSRVYGVYGAGTRSAWRLQEIDLSPWKGQSNVRIRFGVGVDNNPATVADGWAIDDLSVTDLGDARKPYPFYDGFEGEMSQWISSLWTPAQGTAYQGDVEVRNGNGVNLMSDMVYTSALGGAIDLTAAVNPSVTFWAKGTLNHYTQVRLQVSLNGGVNWTELPTCNIDTGTTLANWTKRQASLAAHVGKTIRLRLYTETFYGTAPVAALAVDAFGVGEEAPEPPTLISPANLEIMPDLTPTLVISNAFDCQTDPLSYRFEVYSDAALSNLVAIVPVLASGVDTTAWVVTPALADDAQYWWRCRSIDTGNNVSAWSETGTFFVDLVNHPPTAPLIVSPYADATMPDANGYFIWFAGEDGDLGDFVTGYQLQIATDDAFTNALVAADVDAQPTVVLARLNALPGSAGLAINARYFWRVRSLDVWGEPSVWSAASFIYGELQPETPPEPVTLTGILIANGVVSLTWTASDQPVRVEHTPSLVSPQWEAVPGATALQTTAHSFNAVSNAPQGFYRVVVE